MPREIYEKQVELLVRTLPTVAKEDSFALKGGTAINLFHRDMPRLSVDIDLTYLPTTPWHESLTGIDEALGRIENGLKSDLPDLKVQRILGGSANDTRIQVRSANAQIKIETAPPARGTVHAPVIMKVSEQVEEKFGFAEMSVVAFEDLYAGKLIAALDRQHPRDLYDVHLLYEHEGLTDPLFRTMLAYVAFSSRPPHELLNPNLHDLSDRFTKEFEGMTSEPIGLDELIETRHRLLADIGTRLDANVQRYLLSLHDGNPDFHAIELPLATDLPAVLWKIENLKKLKQSNPKKHATQRKLIEDLF